MNLSTHLDAAKGKPMTETFERVKFAQNRGPLLVFEGKLLASTEFETRAGSMALEIWETPAGAWIATATGTPYDEDSRVIRTATIVPPGDDEMARRCAVMDEFDWEDRARSMVRKQLGWALKIDVA